MARTPEQVDDRSSRKLACEIPQRNVDTGNRVGEESAPVAAHTHQRVKLVPDRGDIDRFSSHEQRAQHIGNDRDHRLRGDDAIRLAPANRTVVRGDLDYRGAIGVRIDRSIASANEIASLADVLVLAQGPEIRNLAR